MVDNGAGRRDAVWSRRTLKVMSVMAALVTTGGLLAALDEPGHLSSWGSLVAGVLLGGVLLAEWRRLPGEDADLRRSEDDR